MKKMFTAGCDDSPDPPVLKLVELAFRAPKALHNYCFARSTSEATLERRQITKVKKGLFAPFFWREQCRKTERSLQKVKNYKSNSGLGPGRKAKFWITSPLPSSLVTRPAICSKPPGSQNMFEQRREDIKSVIWFAPTLDSQRPICKHD